MDEFTKGYMTCALWAAIDDNGNPYDKKFSITDFSLQSKIQIEEECNQFQARAAAELEKAYERGYTKEQAGHDFCLTRNGHGAGFWSRDELEEGELGCQLSKIAEKFGEAYVFLF